MMHRTTTSADGRPRNNFYIHPSSSLQMRYKSGCTPGLKAPSLVITVSILFFIFTVSCVCAVEEIDSPKGFEILQRCKDAESNTNLNRTVISGVPFRLDCDAQFNDQQYYDEYYGSEDEVKCIVTLNDEVILHESNLTMSDYSYDIGSSYTLENTSEAYNGSVFTIYLIENDSCSRISYHLTVIKAVPPQSCSNATFDEKMTLTKEVEHGKGNAVECLAKKSSFHFPTGTVKWFKDCSLIHETNFTDSLDYGDYVMVNSMQIGSEPTVAGEYTCSITFNEQEIFLSKTSVCVKHRQYDGPPAFTAISPQHVKASMGDDVILQCSGVVGSSLGLSFATSWNRNNDGGSVAGICSFYTSESLLGRSFNDEKYHCSLKSNIKEATRCYSDLESFKEDDNHGLTKANSTLTIRNFKPSDVGNYSCNVISTQHPQVVYFVVDINEQTADPLLITLPVIAGALLLILLVLCICVSRGKIKKQWKRTMGRANSLKGSTKDEEGKAPTPESTIHNSDLKELPLEVV